MKICLELEDNFDIPDEFASFSKKENTILFLTGVNAVKVFKTNAIHDNTYFDTLKAELTKQLKEKDGEIATLTISNGAQKAVFDQLLAEETARREQAVARERALLQETIDGLKQELIVSRMTVENYKTNLEKEVATKTAAIQELLLKQEREKNAELERAASAAAAAAAAAKGNVGRGQQGENFFYDLVLDTFADYDGFSITNTAKTGHSGDFHIQFKDFTILADSKNFIDTTGVSSTDRNKLKYDMKQNQHIKIAWLVSIDKPIRRFSKYPYMIELHDGVCYCYINSLKDYENPARLLEMAWYACNFIFHTVLNKEDDILILEKYRKNELRIRDIANKMKRLSKERYAVIKQLTANFDETEKDIMELLNGEIMNIRDEHLKTIQGWWGANFLRGEPSGPKLKSAPIFKKLHEEHPEIGEDVFKQILREILPVEDIEIPKSKTAQYTILNWHAQGL